MDEQVPPGIAKRRIPTVVRDAKLVEARRDQIVKAASRVFVSRGYHEATVREIADEAGISLGSLYSYISTKEDMLYLVFERMTTTLRTNIRDAIQGIDDPVDQIRAALEADLRTTEQYQDEILLLYQESKSLDPGSLKEVLAGEADYVRFFEDILKAGYARGVFKGDPRLSADVIAYLCSILSLRRWNLRRRFATEEAQGGLIAFILRGLGVEPDERT